MRTRHAVALCTVLATGALGAPASASTVGVFGGTTVFYGGGSAGGDVVIDTPTATSVRIVDTDPAENLVSASSSCPESPAETITCTLAATPAIEVFGGTASETLEIAESVTTGVFLFGGDGTDVLLGGSGPDRIGGGLGNDDVDGRGGSDLVENGRKSTLDDGKVADDGPDLYADTGTSGEDALNYGDQTVGVAIAPNGVADDGAPAEGDDVRAGFEKLRGTAFADTVVGGPEAETINGSGGNDDLTGGGGADTVEGNDGLDRLRMRDGVADVLVDCDSASATSPADGETATVDAEDANVQRCEVVERPGGGTGTTTTGTTTTPPPSTPAPGPGGTPPPGGTVGLVPTAVALTATVSRMPRLTGQNFGRARQAALTALAFADVDLVFVKSCKDATDLEVIRQSPQRGATLPSNLLAPIAVKLTVCVAERDFLRDCDLKDLKNDIAALPRAAMDADAGLDLLKSVGKCRVDYDIKLAKQAEEAKIALAAQLAAAEVERRAKAGNDAAEAKRRAALEARNKVKGDLRAGITCPLGGDLRVILTEGNLSARTNLGLKASGPDGWTIPGGPGKWRSAIDVVVTDIALQFPEATVFVDADDVVTRGYGPSPRKTVGGRATLTIDPVRTGKIRICVVQEVKGDQVLSWGGEVRVIAPPAAGTIYETISGRQLKSTGDGATPVAAPRAVVGTGANFLAAAWDALVGFFSGTSRTINEEERSTRPKRVRAERAATTGGKLALGQVSLTGRLGENPEDVRIDANGKCFAVGKGGIVNTFDCPTLVAPNGQGLVGTSVLGPGMVAAGGGNVIRAGAGNVVPTNAGNLVGLDGGTLVGLDGGTLVGLDGGSLVAAGGLNMVAAGGGNAVGPALAQLVNAGGLNLVGNDGASVIARDGAGLVNAGGLN